MADEFVPFKWLDEAGHPRAEGELTDPVGVVEPAVVHHGGDVGVSHHGQREDLPGSDVEVPRHFGELEGAVKAAGVRWPVGEDLPGWHVPEKALVAGLPEELLEAVSFVPEHGVEALSFLKVPPLPGTQLEPGLLLLEVTKVHDALACGIQDISSYDYDKEEMMVREPWRWLNF